MTCLSVVDALSALNRSCEARTLHLRTQVSGPQTLEDLIRNHVQGVTRLDRDDGATLVISTSGDDGGKLWFADFALVADDKHPERCARLAKTGEVVATAVPGLAHPGGLQGSGTLVAVACESDQGWAQVEVYDVSQVHAPYLLHKLVLNNSLKEGVAQLTRSKAAWLGFEALSADEYLLFVGGKQFGEKEGWFYRYRPKASANFAFAGPFAGSPVSSSQDAWGPQNSVAILHMGQPRVPMLISFGSNGDSGLDAMRSKLRCFSLGLQDDGPCSLVQEVQTSPRTFKLPEANLAPLFGANARWGSSAFVDRDGELLLYFTARNPQRDRAGRYVLEITEVRSSPLT